MINYEIISCLAKGVRAWKELISYCLEVIIKPLLTT